MAEDEGDVVQNLHTVDGLADAFYGEHFISDFAVGTEINVGIFTAGRTDLIQLDFFQGTFTARSLFGFGSVGAEPGDELLQLFDFFLFFLVGFFHLTDHQLAGLVPEIVVSGVELDLAVVDVGDEGADLVEEITVMGNDDNRIVEVDEELLKPADCIEVQMVGRLVEQKDIGVSEKGFGQKNFHLLTSVQVLHERVVKLRSDAQTV